MSNKINKFLSLYIKKIDRTFFLIIIIQWNLFFKRNIKINCTLNTKLGNCTNGQSQ